MNTVSVEKLLNIGIALSKEKDNNKIFELILKAAMDITNCDGGTLYQKEGDTLAFQFMITKSNGTYKGGKDNKIELPPVPISKKNVCACALLDKKLINISNVYESERFDFSGPKKYDSITGYRTASMLVVPMEDDEGKCIGVLQLINALNENGEIVSFDKSCELVIRSLASQAAICKVNMSYAIEIQELLDSLVRVMSTAIDARTPYNANHTRNMVKYGERFIEWLEETNNAWQFDWNNKRQFLLSVWFHDSGKITVPLQVMDKETRLGDMLEHLLDRFRIIELLNELAFKNKSIDISTYEKQKEDEVSAKNLVLQVNRANFLTDDVLNEVKELAKKVYIDENNEKQPWLTDDEVVALSVRKGTLTDNERHTMENHVVMTNKMLSEIKFPDNYDKVCEWAGNHHEFLDGSGYPNGLKADDISKEVRLLTILDIFDALTSRDRPYKPAIPLDKALGILDSMQKEGKLDEDILKLFKESRVWEEK